MKKSILYQQWLKQYNITEDPALILKVRHIENVVGFAKQIANTVGLDKNATKIALITAQHHDDGRYLQWDNFKTFNDKQVCEDGLTHPHAVLSIEILFTEGKIFEYYPDLSGEEYLAINKAITRHGDLVLKTYDLTEGQELQCKIIRDADMLDNMVNVKLNETLVTLMKIQGYTLDQLAESEITQEVFGTFMSHHAINYGIVKTAADWWLVWSAYMYNISLPASFSIIRDTNCVDKMFEKVMSSVQFKSDETFNKLSQARQEARDYINSI